LFNTPAVLVGSNGTKYDVTIKTDGLLYNGGATVPAGYAYSLNVSYYAI